MKTIWSNYDLNVEDWKDYLDEELPGITDEYEQYSLIADLNDEYLYDERMNLDIQLDNPIIAIADIGRWNGRVCGYKIIESGNIKDILYTDCDYAEWYLENGNIKFKGSHHDGNNYVTYREIRNMENIENFLDKIYYGKPITRGMLNYYTRSIASDVKKIYGW